MKIILKNDTIVRYPKGSILEVDDVEASRLIAFGNAAKVEKDEKKPKKSTAKKGEK